MFVINERYVIMFMISQLYNVQYENINCKCCAVCYTLQEGEVLWPELTPDSSQSACKPSSRLPPFSPGPPTVTIPSQLHYITALRPVTITLLGTQTWWDCVKNDMESLGLSQKDTQSRNKWRRRINGATG